MAEYDDQVDDGEHSSNCYSNTLFNIDEEQNGTNNSSSTAGSGEGSAMSRSVRSVQFDVADDTERTSERPQFTTVVTRDKKPSIFEKKFRGEHTRR